ncbi:MAG: SDR family NAD(P)-dependent oxidoreductase [Muribaculaceae bacterium]|nr:SDR family NAD(P)-dependent oxidoreductase [Muribaculaceae bacterium]
MDKIIIMGASSGIGLSVAEAFAKRGMKVGLASRHTETLHKLKIRYPECVEYESIDITHKDAPSKLERLISKLGGMDIYFHVSGIGYDNPALDPEREAEMLNCNSTAFARMLSTAYNYFKTESRPGRIAAITSVAGTNGIGQLSAYSASKKCAQTYMIALEQRANSEGVRIKFTDIRPGWIRTPLLKEGVSYPLEMEQSEAVPLIIKALVRAPRVAVVNWKWNIVVGLWRLIPNSLWVKMTIPEM